MFLTLLMVKSIFVCFVTCGLRCVKVGSRGSKIWPPVRQATSSKRFRCSSRSAFQSRRSSSLQHLICFGGLLCSNLCLRWCPYFWLLAGASRGRRCMGKFGQNFFESLVIELLQLKTCMYGFLYLKGTNPVSVRAQDYSAGIHARFLRILYLVKNFRHLYFKIRRELACQGGVRVQCQHQPIPLFYLCI